MKNKYILLRHGQTKYQAKKLPILYKKEEQFSLPITSAGKKKIKEVAKALRKKGIDIIYSSDFYRTRQTAELVSQETGTKIILDKRLRDTDFGFFCGKSIDEYRTFFNNKIERFFKRPPQGESYRDVKKRAVVFFREVEKKHKGKTILIISHADPIWFLTAFLNKLTEEKTLELKHSASLYPDVGDYLEIK